MAANETVPHGLKQFTDGTDKFPGRLGYNDMIDLLNRIPGCGVGPLSSRPLASSGLRFWVEEATGRLSVNLGDTWAGIAEIGGTTTNAVIVGNESSEGASSRAARGDHTHALPLATGLEPGALPAADKAMMDAATPSPTGNALLKRDTNGRAQVAAPNVAGDIATKKYVDDGLAGKSATTHSHVAATPAAPGFMSAADKAKLDVIAVLGDWINLVLGAGFTASTALPPKYRITGDHIEFRGAVIASDPTKKTVMSNLPAQVRPAANFNIEFLADNSVTGLNGQVTVAGELVLTTPVAGKYYGLENIHWFF